MAHNKTIQKTLLKAFLLFCFSTTLNAMETSIPNPKQAQLTRIGLPPLNTAALAAYANSSRELSPQKSPVGSRDLSPRPTVTPRSPRAPLPSPTLAPAPPSPRGQTLPMPGHSVSRRAAVTLSQPLPFIQTKLPPSPRGCATLPNTVSMSPIPATPGVLPSPHDTSLVAHNLPSPSALPAPALIVSLPPAPPLSPQRARQQVILPSTPVPPPPVLISPRPNGYVDTSDAGSFRFARKLSILNGIHVEWAQTARQNIQKNQFNDAEQITIGENATTPYEPASNHAQPISSGNSSNRQPNSPPDKNTELPITRAISPSLPQQLYQERELDSPERSPRNESLYTAITPQQTFGQEKAPAKFKGYFELLSPEEIRQQIHLLLTLYKQGIKEGQPEIPMNVMLEHNDFFAKQPTILARKQLYCGECYRLGKNGFPKDPAEAVKFLNNAEQQNSDEWAKIKASWLLAEIYALLATKDVKNVPTAEKYFSFALQNCHGLTTEEHMMLKYKSANFCYTFLPHTQENLTKVAEYLEHILAAGAPFKRIHVGAQLFYANFYQLGLGKIRKDLAQAEALLNLVAAQSEFPEARIEADRRLVQMQLQKSPRN